MSGNIVPINPSNRSSVAPASPPPLPQSWTPPPPPVQPGTNPITRQLSVFGRYKWMILLVTVIGAAGGVVATRFVPPLYESDAQIWISSEAPLTSGRREGAPPSAVRSPELMRSAGWQQLVRTPPVVDEVVRRLRLYIQPAQAADSALFRDFEIGERFMAAGNYELRTDADGRYRLIYEGARVVEQGVAGDSVGRAVGMQWQPPASAITQRTVSFTVLQPREVGSALAQRLTATPRDALLTLKLEGRDPIQTAHVLNVWVEQFIAVAREYKQAKLIEMRNQMLVHLDASRELLSERELALERHKVNTITKPSEGTAIAPGVREMQPTVLTDFFQQQRQLQELRAEREALQRIMANARTRNGRISDEDRFFLSTLESARGNSALGLATKELDEFRATRRALAATYKDGTPPLEEADRRIEQLERAEIPQLATAMLAQVQQQERDLAGRLSGAERDLQQIPARSIEEQRLERQVQTAAELARRLEMEYQAADLAVTTAIPDVTPFAPAVPRMRPSKNTVPQILAGAVFGSLALGLVLAFLIDRLDQRVRYPEQVKNDLGLDLLGSVPNLLAAPKGRHDPEEAMQVVESFRLIRLNILNALQTDSGVAVTISSAGAGDGKSLIASNLAVSFAEAGHRTLLIDGDIRRGALHTSLGVSQRPGLADVLAGTVPRKEAVRATAQRNLSILPCGTRSRRAPELLDSAAMTELLGQLRASFDVIIVDSPPLSAGIDAYALGNATGNMVVVARIGKTNMRLAQLKLATLDRLPVFVMGAVLNGIVPKGVYEYYGYGYGYAADDEGTAAGESPIAVPQGEAVPALEAPDDRPAPTVRI